METEMTHDFTHCVNDDCPTRETCARYSGHCRDNAHWSYATFAPDEAGRCENYLNFDRVKRLGQWHLKIDKDEGVNNGNV